MQRQAEKTLLLPVGAALAALAFCAEPALAVQQHGGSEGLVSHQLGHVLFIAGMLYLLYRVRRLRLAGPGWPFFKGFLLAVCLWNFITFTGHWLNEVIPADRYLLTSGKVTAFEITSATDAYFYLTRLDHLFLVPAFLLLLAALRSWNREQ